MIFLRSASEFERERCCQLVLDEKINPGKVFDLTLPLNQVARGYKAMDERRAIKALLYP